MNMMKFPYPVSVPIVALAAALCIAFATPVTGAAASTNPSQVVSGFHDALLGVMKDAKALGIKGRYEKLKPKIEQAFYLPLMIQVAASSYWQQADAGQVAKLVEAFTRLSVSTYASQFDGYAGERFETRGEQPGPQQTTLVKTRIVKADGSAVDLTYVMRETKGDWRIVDVLVDNGISELAVKRSEYRGVLRAGGIDGLIETLNTKADQLLAGRPK